MRISKERLESRKRIAEFKCTVVDAWCSDPEMSDFEYLTALTSLAADLVEKMRVAEIETNQEESR